MILLTRGHQDQVLDAAYHRAWCTRSSTHSHGSDNCKKLRSQLINTIKGPFPRKLYPRGRQETHLSSGLAHRTKTRNSAGADGHCSHRTDGCDDSNRFTCERCQARFCLFVFLITIHTHITSAGDQIHSLEPAM